jgi:hypothetical protein
VLLVAEGNVILVLKRSAKKTNVGVEVSLEACLTLALDTDELSVSHPDRFTSNVRAHSTHWMFGWGGGGPDADIDPVEKRTF